MPRVVGIPVAADGPDIEALERALAKQVPKFFYVIPDFQNPAGSTCSGVKRRRIAELATRYGFLVVEDAPYRLLRYRGREEPTIRELIPERTLHMSSFTKLIAPGIRTGFIVGPPEIIAKLAKVAEDTYISPGYSRARHHLRVVPPWAAPAADRASESALLAQARRRASPGSIGTCPRRR